MGGKPNPGTPADKRLQGQHGGSKGSSMPKKGSSGSGGKPPCPPSGKKK